MEEFPGRRMEKVKLTGTEIKPADRDSIRVIFAVSEKRASGMGELNPDLVVPSGLKLDS